MAGLSRAPTVRKYSWWWDSHISPKNSTWLQQNLTDMDVKVKAMIKLIEEDADSFARRAEMYYKKRPELMKLVEEFYRAYRALAERYNKANVALQQAQRTMREAFPDQTSFEINDDPPENSTSEIEIVSKFDKEIQALKDALAKLEAEKTAGLIQYEQSSEKLSKLELELSRVQEASRELNDRAIKAEGVVQLLRDSLSKLEAEKEACLEKIAYLENNVSQVSKAESERDEALDRYNKSLEMISNLENKLKLAKEDANQLNLRAEKAEREAENLKQALIKLTEENESKALQYQQSLEKISNLEHELSLAEEEVQRLKREIDNGVTKLKEAEELCLALEKSNQDLDTELGNLVLKTSSQNEELTEKQKELGKLWACLQEERFRFVEAETAFQTLQLLHSQTQEQMRSLALELENKGQNLTDSENLNQSLKNEISRVNECNFSSSMTIKQLQDEISGLVESRERLVEEVELRVDQRNALQQEIYCLKEDVKSFESSVKELQSENSDLKAASEREKAEKLLLLTKLEIMEQLLEKNDLLEKSLLDLTAELEGARKKTSALERSFEALLEEKSVILAEKAALMSQLQENIDNLEKISEKNISLENSLSDACDELEDLKAKSKTLEDSRESLEKEKSYLIIEKATLVSEGKATQQTLEALEKRQRELEERYSSLERERETTFSKLEELRFSLDVEKKEHAIVSQRTETQLAGMGKQISLLQEEVFCRKREFEEELNNAMNYQLEIFILRSCAVDLKEKNSSLLAECQKLVEGSKISEKVISELKHENLEKQVEVKSLSDKTSVFKMGMCELVKSFDIDLGHAFEVKLEDIKNYLSQVLDENQRLNLEMSIIVTFLGQLMLEVKTLNFETETLDKELKIKDEKLILSQNEANKLLKLNGDLNLKISKLSSLVEDMNKELDEANVISKDLENRNHKLSEENTELGIELKKVEEELGLTTQLCESEVATMFGELQYSTVFRDLLEEKLYELKDNTSKDAQVELLEKKIGSLEGENGEFKAQFAAFVPLVMSLKDSISSLENHTLHDKIQKSHNHGAKEVARVSSRNENADQMMLDVVPVLKDLLDKVKVIEKAVVQNESLVSPQTRNTSKMRACANGKYSVPISDNSEIENEVSMKDIMLDSESSSHELSRQLEKMSWSKRVDSWDSTDLDHDIDLIVGRGKMEKSQKSKNQSSEIVPSKDLGSNKLEILSTFSQHSQDSADLDGDTGRGKMVKSPSGKKMARQKSRNQSSEIEITRTFSQRSQDLNETKILERLNSDADKLSNLQITVQGLIRKVEITEKGKKGKAAYESGTLREQLEEAEEAIIGLSDLNSKLVRSLENRSFSSNDKLDLDFEESGTSRKRRISGHARKASEKIGRLQVEVQKVQIMLLKIDDENEKEMSNKSRNKEMRRRVLLRDYLYGVVRSPRRELRRKRSAFCGCVQPSARGD